MLTIGKTRAEEQRAAALKKASRAQEEQDRARKAKTEQMARLRALRLEKEAAENAQSAD